MHNCKQTRKIRPLPGIARSRLNAARLLTSKCSEVHTLDSGYIHGRLKVETLPILPSPVRQSQEANACPVQVQVRELIQTGTNRLDPRYTLQLRQCTLHLDQQRKSTVYWEPYIKSCDYTKSMCLITGVQRYGSRITVLSFALCTK